MLCIPRVSRDTLLGVTQVMTRLDGRPFDERQLRLVQILADHVAIAIENASLYRQAQVAALTDDLTGLGNSRQLNQVLPQLIATRHPLALLGLDFDNFKHVVDRYCHLVGGQTLPFIGRIIPPPPPPRAPRGPASPARAPGVAPTRTKGDCV